MSDDPDEWPAAQVLIVGQADAYDAFAREVEALRVPDTVILDGEPQDLGRDASALIGWSMELATLLRQVAAADSFEAAMAESYDFRGTPYPIAAFVQDATGEWAAAMSLTADDLGIDLPQR